MAGHIVSNGRWLVTLYPTAGDWSHCIQRQVAGHIVGGQKTTHTGYTTFLGVQSGQRAHATHQ